MYGLLACSGSNRKAANEESDDYFIRTLAQNCILLPIFFYHGFRILKIRGFFGRCQLGSTFFPQVTMPNSDLSLPVSEIPVSEFRTGRPHPYVSQSQLSKVGGLSSIRLLSRRRCAKRGIPTTAMPSNSSPSQ